MVLLSLDGHTPYSPNYLLRVFESRFNLQVEDLVAQNQKLRDELSVASAALKEAQAEITRSQGVNHSSSSSSLLV
jgi:phosphoglycerate-specific signal transduction histidine kinase